MQRHCIHLMYAAPMSGDVKRDRPYDNRRRQQQSLETQQIIIDAAGKLFAEHTYAATSIAAIATAAGVSQRTVYNTFGSKAVLLRRYVESSMVGDHDDRPIADRDWANGAYQAPTASERIAVLAATSARIMANAGESLRVAWQAASSGDPSIAEEWRRGQAHRRTTANRFIDTMANDELLDQRIDTTAAKHTVWLLLAPETYSQMTQAASPTTSSKHGSITT